MVRGILFKELCDYYLKHVTPNKRSPDSDESIIRVHLRPFFGERSLNELHKDIEQYKTAKKHLRPKTVHNHLTLLVSMLGVAKTQGWLLQVPKIKKPKVRVFEKDFCYLRTDAEIKHFLAVARAVSEQAFVLYSTAIFTGLRAGELAGLNCEDIDFEKRLITLQRSYEGLTKNGEARYIPILDPLLRLTKVEQP